ncbi:MAG: hypothetical protein ACMUJI_13525 [Erythrobacter sp.]|uniref:hypothetical protein n=1 Tax=Erythrobacter sp. TaxID=1042 RepID=UPI003A894C60
MMSETNQANTKSPTRKAAIAMAIGAVVGFVTMFAVSSFLSEGWIGEFDKSTKAAVLVGAFYVVMGLGVALGALKPKVGARILNVEDEEELMEQRGMLLNSCYAASLWGVGLVVAALGGENGVIPAATALIIAGILIALGSYFAWQSYRASDELMAAVNSDAMTIGYCLTFAVVGGWALLEHLGLAAGQDPIDVITMFYVLSMVATFVATGRRGLLKPR